MQVDNYGHGLNNIRQRKRAQSEKEGIKNVFGYQHSKNLIPHSTHIPQTKKKNRGKWKNIHFSKMHNSHMPFFHCNNLSG